MYKPGLHIISEFQVENPKELSAYDRTKAHLNQCIEKHGLSKIGEIYHSFPEGGGYTAVICLTESHISIHTWPEFNRVTFDVFLSNFARENNATVVEIHDGLLKLMKATDVKTTRLNR